MTECYLYRLPNELLIHLLTPMTTPDLLPLAPLSHRIYTIVLRILHNRLVLASELESHSVLLECFHPSAKLTEPPYFCSYHGTDGLARYDELSESDKHLASRLGDMRKMYSRFRPHRRELETGGRRVRAPGDVPGSRTFPGTTRDGFEGDTVKQILSLDEHELFTQLVAQTHLVKIGPRHIPFTYPVDIEEGVIRVWREWLRDTAAKGQSVKTKEEELEVAGTDKGKAPATETSQADRYEDVCDSRILWVSPNKNTGIRFNVRERKLRRDIPILVRTDEEDMPVSYEIEYDELLIRTSHLLLMLEKSLVQDDNTSGKAVVFGSFG
ncbi:hypothetical protein P171DRAFT_424509 [Karstenula rhodostoma CBS 690.94]|uniref:F-box domain-containing protein n=1 Tax=Karstenula rhodostoma CBS 690.94 TaxID=1392251 RepID=A0A9P4U5H6_9PLEO|nr:hypothetical protein P171DRAFT_424509 [Karstenula rhodostoma CBS 690.94]